MTSSSIDFASEVCAGANAVSVDVGKAERRRSSYNGAEPLVKSKKNYVIRNKKAIDTERIL